MKIDNSKLEELIGQMKSSNTTLSDLQKYTDLMINTRGFENETPQDIMLLMTEEVGELAKAVRKTTNIKMDISKDNDKYDVKGEITDVLNYLLAMCRVFDIDLLEAFKEKELRNCKREWK